MKFEHAQNTLKYKVGDVVVLAENVDQNWRKTFVPGVAVKIDQLCDLNSDGEHYSVKLVSDPSDYWYIKDAEINHEATAKLQTSNESGYLVQKISAENDVVSSAVSTSDNQPKAQDNSWYENGELPPVETKCIFFSDGFENEDYWNEDLTNECEVEIVAHFKSYKDCSENDVAAFVFEYKGGSYQVEQAIASCFRPWYSDEEIAEQERERVVNKMCDICNPSGIYPETSKLMCRRLYDAGLRFAEEE